MYPQNDIRAMLELMVSPAFCVDGDAVGVCNHAARQLLLKPGTSLSQLLGQQFPAYREFTDGCLFVTLQHEGCHFSATVSRVGNHNIFVIDQQQQTELRIMAMIARSLRLPLSDIINTTDQLFPSLDAEADDTTRHRLSQINRRLTQMNRTILNMADAARYTSDTCPRLTLQEVESVFYEILERAQSLAQSAGITLEFHIPHSSTLCLMDTEKLERAVYNMLANAIKASPAGGTVQVDLHYKNHRLYFSVLDHGAGIPNGTMGSVFSRYHRDAGLEDRSTGLGLGMVLIRAAATAHKGTVLLMQPPGGGTKIILSFPVCTDMEVPVSSPLEGFRPDYAGERDHGLLELSEVLPPELYTGKK